MVIGETSETGAFQLQPLLGTMDGFPNPGSLWLVHKQESQLSTRNKTIPMKCWLATLATNLSRGSSQIAQIPDLFASKSLRHIFPNSDLKFSVLAFLDCHGCLGRLPPE